MDSTLAEAHKTVGLVKLYYDWDFPAAEKELKLAIELNPNFSGWLRCCRISRGPKGRVHFAGDHTSPWPGWMNGALQSGNRAAREVNQA